MPSSPPDRPEPAGRANFLQTLKAVLWSFFGVRRNRDMHADASLNPVHVIAMGVGLAFCLVVGLIVLVRFITR